MIIAVDIDGVLCEEMENNWQYYHKCVPIQHSIDLVNKLFSNGHIIVIYSARLNCDYIVTKDWLDKHNVRYHKLILGKFKADKYVDDRHDSLENLI